MAVLQFCTISRHQPAWHPGWLGWSVHFHPPGIMLVHCFVGSVNTLYLYHLISAQHHSLLALGDSINVVSGVDFWMGEWTKGYLV